MGEGALVEARAADAEPFSGAASPIEALSPAGTALASDEAGVRESRADWRPGVSYRNNTAVFTAAARRSRAVVEACLGGPRSAFRISDCYGAQAGRPTLRRRTARRRYDSPLMHHLDFGQLNDGVGPG